jgi:hypothetical protein
MFLDKFYCISANQNAAQLCLVKHVCLHTYSTLYNTAGTVRTAWYVQYS